MVAEHTFRPPWFHRNVMSEFMGLVHGAYDAKAGGFAPGAMSLHNCMSAHGPDVASWQAASAAELKPHKIENTLAFMFESRWVFRPTAWAMDAPQLQAGYDACWDGFPKRASSGGALGAQKKLRRREAPELDRARCAQRAAADSLATFRRPSGCADRCHLPRRTLRTSRVP